MKEPTPNRSIDTYDYTTEEAWKQFVENNLTVLKDYNQRPITLIESAFINNVDSKLINEIDNVIQKPDEVWYKAEEKGNTFNQFMYVKYYQDSEPLAFVAELKDGNFIIRQLAKLADLALRWGLLIKN